MSKKTARNLGGRPRSEDRAELTASQIARQDAMSRRTQRQITEIERDHLDADEVRVAWAREQARVRHFVMDAYCGPTVAPGVLAASTKNGVVGVENELKRVAYALLRRLAAGDRPAVRAARLRLPPVLRPSRTLALARARHGRLQAQLIELRERARAGASAFLGTTRP